MHGEKMMVSSQLQIAVTSHLLFSCYLTALLLTLMVVSNPFHQHEAGEAIFPEWQ